MSITKTERRIAIGIGVTIGIIISSLLVRYALTHKEESLKEKPGNYLSMRSAIGDRVFPPIPSEIEKNLPNGIVVHYDENQSIQNLPEGLSSRNWVIETHGAFRSERLFILVDEILNSSESSYSFYRASELYVKLKTHQDLDSLANEIDENQLRILGQNDSTKELIMQTKYFSPKELKLLVSELPLQHKEILSVRLIPWSS